MAKEKIFVVEDDKDIVEVIKYNLTKEGYQVSVARNGEEGLRTMKEKKPDLILLDIIMPKMGGFEVMEEMQKNAELKKIPVIVISNSGQPVELDRAQKLGAKDYLVKSNFTPQEVVEKIKIYLK